jgi:cell division initiation protein
MKTKLTPLEIQQQRFATSFRGYNTAEVDSFLDQAADTIEALMVESESLREKNLQLSQDNQDFRAREESFKRVMLNSQKVLEQMKDNARKSSEVLVAQAEVDAERIIQSAHHKLARMHEEINELKRQKIQFKAQLKSMIQSHAELLEIDEIEQIDFRVSEPVVDEEVSQIDCV